MKLLLKIWPWKALNQMREDAIRLGAELEDAKADNAALKRELNIHQERAVQNQKDARKMAQIIALKGGILAIMFMCLSAFGQPFIRNPVDTNSLGNAPTTAYFLGWDGVLTKPKWAVPPGGTNYWDYNGFLFPLLSTVVSNASGFADPGGLVSQNATNHDWVVGAAITNGAINNLSNYVNTITVNATNNDTVVSNGVVAHTVTVAGTANQITSSVGTAQTLAANPATTLSIPSVFTAPGTIAAVTGFTNQGFTVPGVMTNDDKGKFFSTATLPTSLITGNAGSLVVGGGILSGLKSVVPWWIGFGAGNVVSSATNEVNMPFDATIDKLFIFCNTAQPGSGTNVTVALQVNNVDSALTVTLVGDGSTAKASDTTHSVNVSASDNLKFHVTATNPTGFTPTMMVAVRLRAR